MVVFVANILSMVLPGLDHFNMDTAVAMGELVPWTYVVYAFLYAGLYCLAMLVVSLLLFEDRDLA